MPNEKLPKPLPPLYLENRERLHLARKRYIEEKGLEGPLKSIAEKFLDEFVHDKEFESDLKLTPEFKNVAKEKLSSLKNWPLAKSPIKLASEPTPNVSQIDSSNREKVSIKALSGSDLLPPLKKPEHTEKASASKITAKPSEKTSNDLKLPPLKPKRPGL